MDSNRKENIEDLFLAFVDAADGWDKLSKSEVQCPACKSSIPFLATRCQYCHSDFKPRTKPDLLSPRRRDAFVTSLFSEAEVEEVQDSKRKFKKAANKTKPFLVMIFSDSFSWELKQNENLKKYSEEIDEIYRRALDRSLLPFMESKVAKKSDKTTAFEWCMKSGPWGLTIK